MTKSLIMKNLFLTVEEFKSSLLSALLKNNKTFVDGKNYTQYSIRNAIYCLIEMEKAAHHFIDFPLEDQKQIMFWAIQMRDEAKRILKKEFDFYYDYSK
jgi:hypothetical protein